MMKIMSGFALLYPTYQLDEYSAEALLTELRRVAGAAFSRNPT